MAQECPIKEPLVVADTQDGIAGPTGPVWTIEPDCSFAVAEKVGPRTSDPQRRGQLTAEQQVRLKEVLAHTDLERMPEQLGPSGQHVNARRISVAFHGRTTVLTLPPGGGEMSTLRAGVSDPSAARLLELAIAIKAMTGG